MKPLSVRKELGANVTRKDKTENPYDALERIFHEPNRLAIMSALCAADRGLSFNELKETCSLTDGNLNRHLRALEKADAVNIAKEFVGAKPRTTVSLSKSGLARFTEYLDALAGVLKTAVRALPAKEKKEEKTNGLRTAEQGYRKLPATA